MRNYSLDNLQSSNFFNNLVTQINDVEFYNDTMEARNILLGLKKAIKSNQDKLDPELIDQYREIKVRLKFILFLDISNDEVLDLLKHHIAVGIQMGYIDLLELLKTRISFLPMEDRDAYKDKIKNILLSNKEMLTRGKVKVGEESVGASVVNWLKVYNVAVGGGPATNLAQSNFYVRNSDFIHLSDKEKLDLKELFAVYEYLKRSSKTLSGNEDNMFVEDIDGSVSILKDGVFIDVSAVKSTPPKPSKKVENFLQATAPVSGSAGDTDAVSSLAAMAQQHSVGSLERRAIEEEIARLK